MTMVPAIRNISGCAKVQSDARDVVGVSSNGRTAVSGAVCEGSTPSTPATISCILAWHIEMAPSSSGLGRRPLKAEVAGSNPVGATSNYEPPAGGSFLNQAP